jgi:transposase InsO family protein
MKSFPIISHAGPATQPPTLTAWKTLNKKWMNKQPPLVLHTDRGSVYSSRAFAKAHEQYTTIVQSMSRAGTPTDNPVIEAINGWIKQEMILDFKLPLCENLQSFLDDFVHYYNHLRPASALNYKSPVQFKATQGF